MTTAARTIPAFIVCATCHNALTPTPQGVACGRGHRFGSAGGSIFFVDPDHAQDEEWSERDVEHRGMQLRVDNYLLPWLRDRFGDESRLRVLEDGCGVGTLVAELAGRGVDAYGIDPGPRLTSWWRLDVPNRLHVADGTRLPFADESFDVVTSSGVLEHVGEDLDNPGRTLPRAERDAARSRYLSEALRVLKPGGKLLLAQPNGAHPLDYWHPGRYPIRPHRPYEAWMPAARGIRRYVATAPYEADLRFLPPDGYLAFNNVRRHWYGRLFAPPVQRAIGLLSRHPRLITSPLNPWLMAEVTKLAPGDGAGTRPYPERPQGAAAPGPAAPRRDVPRPQPR